MRRWLWLVGGATLFLAASAGGLGEAGSLASLVTTMEALGVNAVLWFGPGGVALWLSRRRPARCRRIYELGAAFAFAPVLLLEATSAIDVLRRYDGFCHHAPDIRYPCSALVAVLDAGLLSSPFALFGALVLGVPAFAIGALALSVAHWLAN